MILIDRGAPDQGEAKGLAHIETVALQKLRGLIAQEGRDPTSSEIVAAGDYSVAKELLWERQGRKCAYCESRGESRRNDVDHFRPKARADRGALHPQKHGYWWLAWRWENLLFACRNCNQPARGNRGKCDRFPLAEASGVLVAEQDPYGTDSHLEQTVLIDPSIETGVAHIEFTRIRTSGVLQWRPVARNGSLIGAKTIEVCDLDRADLLDLYTDHVETVVRPEADRFDEVQVRSAPDIIRAAWEALQDRLYRKGMPYVGLSYDALRCFVPDDELAAHGLQRRMPL